MKIAALSDIHGNVLALEAVLREVEADHVDAVVICGDVAAGPMPEETVHILRGLGPEPHFVRGNADREILECMDGRAPPAHLPAEVRKAIEWCAGRLGRSDRDFLAEFRSNTVLASPAHGPILFCHAVPESDTPVFTANTPAEWVQHHFVGHTERLVVCGHTHMQFDRKVGITRVVNTGSVGMPYGEPGAYWLLLDDCLHHRCADYDYRRAAGLVRASAYPSARDFAESILRPPTAEEALAVFDRRAAEAAAPP
jgi:predicted phosphodiesterase